MSLGGVSDVGNKSLAIGYDRSISSTLLADFRFGWFRYNVAVLPFDFGTRPAQAAGIPGLNLDDTFTSGLPALFVEGSIGGFNAGSGLGVNQCNCPLDQDESQWQMVGNVTKIWSNHTFKFGADVRRAHNLRVPSDSHRSGELTFNTDRTRGPSGGGLGLASFLLGDVYLLRRYVSTNTDARERQWRHFYYAQDTWRPTPKLTLNYGLRLDIINPQTVNEPGNGGWLDLETGLINVGGVGDVDLAGNTENRLNWAPRLGATYQIDEKTVIRGGFGRTYDIGVFGSLFGHSVTQNLPVLASQELRGAENFQLRVQPRPGTDRAGLSDRARQRPVPAAKRRLLEGPAPEAASAVGGRVQRHRAAATHRRHVGRSGICRQSGSTRLCRRWAGRGRKPTDARRVCPGCAAKPAPAVFCGPADDVPGPGRRVRLDAGHRLLLQLREELVRLAAGEVQQAVLRRLRLHGELHLAKSRGGRRQLLLLGSRSQQGGGGLGPHTHRQLHADLRAAVRQEQGRYGADWSTPMETVFGGWQFNATHTVQSGLPFDVGYANSGADRDTGPGRPNLIGDPEGEKTRTQWFNTTPIGASGSAFGDPAIGTFGDLERSALRGPYYRRTDASIFKHFRFGGSKDVEIRIEVVNLFNVVNLGNPDSEVGTPGNARPNAGRISSTAYGGGDPQRNIQFAAKFCF